MTKNEYDAKYTYTRDKLETAAAALGASPYPSEFECRAAVGSLGGVDATKFEAEEDADLLALWRESVAPFRAGTSGDRESFARGLRAVAGLFQVRYPDRPAGYFRKG